MPTTVSDLRSFSHASSRTTKTRPGIASANLWRAACIIPGGWEVHGTDAVAVVQQSFIVEVKLTEEEYQVTSSISNAYEFGETVSQALQNYLALLVDELLWLDKHKSELLPAIGEDFRLLQGYIRMA